MSNLNGWHGREKNVLTERMERVELKEREIKKEDLIASGLINWNMRYRLEPSAKL